MDSARDANPCNHSRYVRDAKEKPNVQNFPCTRTTEKFVKDGSVREESALEISGSSSQRLLVVGYGVTKMSQSCSDKF